MTEFNDMADNNLKNDVAEKVRDILDRYHQVSHETVKKILSDKDARHDEMVNILTSRLLIAQAERKQFADKATALDEELKKHQAILSETKDKCEEKLSHMKELCDVRISEYRLEKEHLELELKSQKEEFEKCMADIRKDANRVQSALLDESTALRKMLEESIELAEKFFKEKMSLTIEKRK